MKCEHGFEGNCYQCTVSEYRRYRDRMTAVDDGRSYRSATYDDDFYSVTRRSPAVTPVTQYDLDRLRSEVDRLSALVQKLISIFSPDTKV
jgi:hypothetical protein